MRNIFPLGSGGLGDAELVSAARTGDADAYAELSARHIDSARRLARQLVSPDAVDGLVEEAFTKVRLVLQRGDGPDLAFRPYLLTAVRRLHVDHTPIAAPEVAGARDDAAAARGFSSLPEPWRMVLWHAEVEEESPHQVAELMGERPESIPALVARAHEGMRIALITRHDQTTDQECDWTRHNLGAYVRKVSFDRDTARVARHLGSCERCATICLELTEGSIDVRGVLAPLVLGSASAGYLADSTTTGARPVAVARAGAAIGGVTGLFTGAFGAVRGAAAATAAAPGHLADAVGVRLGRAKDFVADRTAAIAVAGVAAIVMVGGGIFVVGQTMDGQLEASADSPLGVALDDDSFAPTETSDTADTADTDDGAPLDRLGDAAAIVLPAGSTAAPSSSESTSDEPTDARSDVPSDLPSDPPGLPGPGQPSDDATQGSGQQPSQQPTRPPTQQPSQPPTQQPTQPPIQHPTQQPTQPPTQAPAPPMDLSISASSTDMAGMFWRIEVRVTGLAPGRTATLVVQSSGGNATGLTMDNRCTRVSGGGATCRVNETPATYRFGAQALLGGPNTLTFTVYPDGESDADTSNNSTSVTIRP